MAEVGGQLRCDGRTLKYETVVVGYFELQDTFSERERGRGRFWEEVCSARYARRSPEVSQAQPCAGAEQYKCQLGGREGWRRDKTGGGSEPESTGWKSYFLFISFSVVLLQEQIRSHIRTSFHGSLAWLSR